MKPIAKLSRILLAGTAALAMAGPATFGTGETGLAFIQPASAASIQVDFFYDRLSPHGSWINHRRHGYVFVPAVGSGWRPYTRGHWIYTDAYGWYWESEEPFAWATYHYGRWGYDNAFGWFWVPGNVWGPAWVSWRHGGGNVGWAPIGPGDHDGYVYGSPEYYEPPVVEAWVFVPERRFVAVDVARYVTPVVEINLFLGKARERHHVNYRDGHGYNGFLPRDRVTKIVNKEVNIYNITTVNSPDEIRRGDRNRGDRDRGDRNGRQIEVFRADVSDTQPRERPKRVVNSAQEIKSAPTLKQTAKGKRPEGAPPSVAELKKEDNVRKPGDDDRDQAQGRDRKPGDGDAKSRDNARGDSDRDGKEKNAERKGDDETPKQAGREQDGKKSGKRGEGDRNAKQDDDKSSKQKARQGDSEKKAKQAERKEDAAKDDDKAKAAEKAKQREREKAEPKSDNQKQRSREASPKQNDQPKGEGRGEGQQKQKQANPEREQKQKQANPEREQKQKQANPEREQKQKQAKPERQREAPPQRESRKAPQGEPKAERQVKRDGPQQGEKQGKPNKKQQAQGREGGQGGGDQQQERGGPNR